ncbi:MAG: hypothetical protein QNJ35_10750 [Paracoccaceae bacterium]|nr:hypothetical protein [Paracoccaceae bacterium]
MQILFHLGAHHTDDGQLIRSILKNREMLGREGVGAPGPGRYRDLLEDVMESLAGETSDAETETALLDAIRDDESAERIILSHPGFLGAESDVLAPDRLYPLASTAGWLPRAFPSHASEFALCIRNPATFLPAALGKDGAGALSGAVLEDFAWSDVIDRIAETAPETPILVWRHEDAPLLWSEILREVAGLDALAAMEGGLDMLGRALSAETLARLTALLGKHEDMSEPKRRKTIAAFLDGYRMSGPPEGAGLLDGWTPEVVAELTALYEEDAREIATTPGVTFLEP